MTQRRPRGRRGGSTMQGETIRQEERTTTQRGRRTAPPASPYRRVVPADLEVEADPLRLRLDFHDESVLLHDYGARGAVATRLVSALDVAHALASELDLTTGLLPPGALWVVKRSSGAWTALWQEPGTRTVRLRTSLEAP